MLFLFLQTWVLFSIGYAASKVEDGGGPLGLGIMFGEPTGINLKYWTGKTTALNFGITYSFGNYLVLLGDCLWHFKSLLSLKKNYKESAALTPYLGGGVLLAFQNSTQNYTGLSTGLRIPAGIEYLPRNPSIGIFAEIAPGITLAPSITAFLQGDIGIRYYF